MIAQVQCDCGKVIEARHYRQAEAFEKANALRNLCRQQDPQFHRDAQLKGLDYARAKRHEALNR